MEATMFEIYRECIFAASHQLRNYKGKCERLHGHNWKVGIHLSGAGLDQTGMLLDFHELDKVLKEVVSRFDHAHLNDVEPFTQENPSSERLAMCIFKEVESRITRERNISVKCCDIWENGASRARYYPE